MDNKPPMTDNNRAGLRNWRKQESSMTAEDHDNELLARMERPSSKTDSSYRVAVEEKEFTDFGETSLFADPGSDWESEDFFDSLRIQ